MGFGYKPTYTWRTPSCNKYKVVLHNPKFTSVRWLMVAQVPKPFFTPTIQRRFRRCGIPPNWRESNTCQSNARGSVGFQMEQRYQ